MKQPTTKDIRIAAENAVAVVATAAKEAARTVADAAAQALKVTSATNGNDHDLIVELKTKIEGIRDDIKDLKDGTTERIANHELRLNTLETEKTRTTVMLSIGVGILTLLVSLLVWHLMGKG
jgi:formylmethanofuran dehydrogenase subunit B